MAYAVRAKTSPGPAHIEEGTGGPAALVPAGQRAPAVPHGRHRRTQAVTVDQVVAGWFAARRERSILTARAYAVAWVDRVGPYVSRLGGVQAIGPAEAAGILRDLSGTLGPSARNQTASAMSSLWKELQRCGLVRDNPWTLVKRAPVRETVGERIIDADQVADMIRAAPAGPHRALVRLLYATGARVSEICRDPKRDKEGQRTGLYWRDVRRRTDGSATLTLFGKRGKTRYVRIRATVLAEIWALSGTHADDEPVFRTLTGRMLDRYRGSRWVTAAQQAAGVRTHMSAHGLRHCHATHALANGAPLNGVQIQLGHSRLDTTGIYTRLTGEGGSGEYLDIPEE